MKCVSYTRALSGCVAYPVDENAIKNQNQAIMEFVKKQGWKISKKYSDRAKDREEEKAFCEMKQAGINREYECVVFSSLFYAGKNCTAATDLLALVFCPVGIQFAVAEDGFYSGDKTMEEVEEYIGRFKTDYAGRRSSLLNNKYSLVRAYRKYGYVLTPEQCLSIDDEAAEVVRKIFKLCCEGKTMVQIAEHLNREGVLSPGQYEYKYAAGKYGGNSKQWEARMVNTILGNELYTGIWRRKYCKKEFLLSCPVIISRELFDEAKCKRGNGTPRKLEFNGGPRAWHAGLAVDEETNHPLAYIGPNRKLEPIFRFKYPAPRPRMYEKCSITENDLTEGTKSAFVEEQKKALCVKKHLENGDAEKLIAERVGVVRKQAVTIFEQMAAYEKAWVRHVYDQEYESLQESDFIKEKQIHEERQREMDAMLQDCIDKMKAIEFNLSIENPWLKSFLAFNIDESLVKSGAGKYIEKICVFRFEKVHIIFKDEKWRSEFPQEWLEEIG